MQSSSNNSNPEPKLDPPGAGLPFIQRLMLKYYMGPYVSKRTPWEVTARRFDKVYRKILLEIEGLSPEEMTTKFLVPSQPGLEDSSRYWSIAMTLEHLLIVGEGMKLAIVELSNGRTISQKVDIAKVKPLGHIPTDEVVWKFKEFTEYSMNDLDSKVQDRNSPTTLVHPWFGPINCQQWHWLLAVHGAIHLKQIQEIKKGIRGSSRQRS